MDSLNGFDSVVLLTQGLKLFWAVAGAVAIFLLLRFFDVIRGRRFNGVDPDSAEMVCYLGLRYLGTAIYFAAVLSSCLLIVVALRPAPAEAAAAFPSRYDRQIELAASRWLPGVPWRLWKAQLYQESRLDPEARSPAGAEGLAQFMPATWNEITRAMGYGLVDRRIADASIQAGAYYMARLRRQWSAPRPERDRHDLAMASYNAGIGHILAAQRLCRDPPLYDAIMACLPQITGRHARETLGYAPSIRRWHAAMEIAR